MLIKFASFFDQSWSQFANRFGSKLETKFYHVFCSNFDRFFISFGCLLGTLLGTIWGPFRPLGDSGGHLGATLTPNEVNRSTESCGAMPAMTAPCLHRMSGAMYTGGLPTRHPACRSHGTAGHGPCIARLALHTA